MEKASDLPFDAPNNAKGVYQAGIMYLVAEQISFPEDAKVIIFHEFVGHFGLRGFFGSTLNDARPDIHTNNPLVKKYAAESNLLFVANK